MKTEIYYPVFLFVLMACSKPADHEMPSSNTHGEHKSTVNPGTAYVMLTDNQLKLGNITTLPVTKTSIGQTMAINGRLTIDEQKSEVISSRAAGRIEKLFVKETGQSIKKGQPLYTLYSEELLTLQQEYLLAKEQYEVLGQTEGRYKSFLDAAERKLLLYGLTKPQISRLNKDSSRPTVTFVSPAMGVITEVSAAEGQYIAEGAALYKMEDVGSLWVEAGLYANETSLVNEGDQIRVLVGGAESTPIETTVVFLSPEFKNNTQTTMLRANIDNPENTFKPGQHAEVFLTHSVRQAISIPVDAVIRDGEGAHVYVQAGRNTFQPRVVQTGIESFDHVEITQGLSERDTIAASGAYLLYSAFVLRNGR